MKDQNKESEDFLLKKIRHYQGTIKDYETFWNERIASGEHELSPETKACAGINANLNKAFEIVPVSKDDEPKPEEKQEEKKKKEKDEKKDDEEKKDSKSDKKKKHKKEED